MLASLGLKIARLSKEYGSAQQLLPERQIMPQSSQLRITATSRRANSLRGRQRSMILPETLASPQIRQSPRTT